VVILQKAGEFMQNLYGDPARRPWIELALVLWTLLMLGVILVALSPSPASSPMEKTLPSEAVSSIPAPAGEVLPPEPVRSPTVSAPTVERVTFRERWSPVVLPALPATTVTPVALVAPPPMLRAREPVAEPVRELQPEPAPLKVKARGVCERHGLKKVFLNRYRWRCRR
jgi:hypothetical protein